MISEMKKVATNSNGIDCHVQIQEINENADIEINDLTEELLKRVQYQLTFVYNSMSVCLFHVIF